MEKTRLPSKEIIHIESSDEDEPNLVSAPTTPIQLHVDNDEAGVSSFRKRPLEDINQASELGLKKPRETTSIRYLDPSIRLTNVQRAPAAHNVNCVSLTSLIGDPDLELMVQINYMIEVDFLMANVHDSIRDGLRTIVYHGLRYTPDQLRRMDTNVRTKYPRITLHSVQVSGNGTHHTKAMILFYRDGTMQFVVHTANMIERDWRNKTQAAFSTGRLSQKLNPTGIASCAFERDILEYMSRYPQHEEIIARMRRYDFTGVKGVLIASVPGKFTGLEKNKWGHLKLRAVLRQQVEIPRDRIQGSKVICQISSIGSLGKSSQDWLRGEFETSLSAHRNSNYLTSGSTDLRVIFPTAENVRTSYEGWTMGGSLPFQSTSYAKQAHYLNPILHSWRAVKSGRERAMPHIKTYTRVTSKDDGDYLSWFLVTSANLSKPAWGEMKANTLMIKSYELGVLVFPGLFEDQNASDECLHVYMMNAPAVEPYPEPYLLRPVMESNDKEHIVDAVTGLSSTSVGVVPIRLPYDLPLKKYDFERGDQVWLSDKFFPGQDDYGNTLER